MTLPDMLLIDGIEYRRADRDAPDAKDPTERHSGFPWEEQNSAIVGGSDIVCEGPSKTLYPTSLDRWPANRALILRAVNHHAELLAFVESIGTNAGSRYDACASSVRREARELLAKVKS